MQSPPNKPKHAASDGPGRAESGRGRCGEARSLKDLTARYLTEPRLGRIPWLIHGFGTAAWAEADFAKVREWNGFRPVILDQVHSDIIHRVDTPPDGRLEGDALITSAPGLFLVVKTADCLPVLVVDEARRVVAAVHCGWRGTWKRILEQVVGELRARYGCRSRGAPRRARPLHRPRLLRGRPGGPGAIRSRRIPGQPFPAKPGGRRKISSGPPSRELPRLQRAGLGPENVLSLDACTQCRPELLSYRRDGTSEGRMFAFIGMKA